MADRELLLQWREALKSSADCIDRMADGPHRADWGDQLDTIASALASMAAVIEQPPARMLTSVELDQAWALHCDVDNTAEAIQRKFCEVNSIHLAATPIEQPPHADGCTCEAYACRFARADRSQDTRAGGAPSDEREALEELIAGFRLSNWADDQGDGLPLVDRITSGATIEEGQHQIELLADEISAFYAARALCAGGALSAAGQQIQQGLVHQAVSTSGVPAASPRLSLSESGRSELPREPS